MTQSPPPVPPMPAQPVMYPPSPQGTSSKTVIIILVAVAGGLILVVALLVAILLPALNAARERANRVKCASNLKQIGLGMTLYSNDYRSYPRLARCSDPPSSAEMAQTMFMLTQHAYLSTSLFCCPSTDAQPDTAPPTAVTFAKADHTTLSYGLTNPVNRAVGFGWRSGQSADWVIAGDNGFPAPGQNSQNHCGDGQNVLLNDGSAQWVTTVRAGKLVSGAADDITTPSNDPMDTYLLPLKWP
jgi:hypothetical protein